ncbi:G-D-S-L family lipolytic protein [Russula earlei]|uniref:G-D-S-L family lipolytic protein n=1 Tax=Russula earlei TaxID=71964 RepID=A0ACC0U4Q1_9AGAM|nr:G-D-S-L family lipolytic protein [Russula earlei]
MKYLVCVLILACLLSSFSHKDIKWVAIGDSITYLNDHPNETGNRVTKGYMTRVTEKLPYIHYTNQGHNGWTAARMADNIEKLGLEKADVYTILLGTNDWWHEQPIGNINDYLKNTGSGTLYGSFRIIINKLRSLNAVAKVILITPMQRGDFVQVANPKNNAWGSYKDKKGQLLSRFAAAIDSIGRYEHFPVIDLYNTKKLAVQHMVAYKRLKDPQTGAYTNYTFPDYTNIPFNAETDEYPYPVEAIDVTYDGLHPSDKGNKIISKLIIKEMKEAF